MSLIRVNYDLIDDKITHWHRNAKIAIEEYDNDSYKSNIIDNLIDRINVQGALKSSKNKNLITAVISIKSAKVPYDQILNKKTLNKQIKYHDDIISFIGKTCKQFTAVSELSIEGRIEYRTNYKPVDGNFNYIESHKTAKYYVGKAESSLSSKGKIQQILLGKVIATRIANNHEFKYLDSIYGCNVQPHTHIVCTEKDYEKLQSKLRHLRSKDDYYSDWTMRKAKTGSLSTNKDIARFAGYLTKVNYSATANSVRSNRFMVDMPVYNELTAKMRTEWIKVQEIECHMPNNHTESQLSIFYLKKVLEDYNNDVLGHIYQEVIDIRKARQDKLLEIFKNKQETDSNTVDLSEYYPNYYLDEYHSDMSSSIYYSDDGPSSLAA